MAQVRNYLRWLSWRKFLFLYTKNYVTLIQLWPILFKENCVMYLPNHFRSLASHLYVFLSRWSEDKIKWICGPHFLYWEEVSFVLFEIRIFFFLLEVTCENWSPAVTKSKVLLKYQTHILFQFHLNKLWYTNLLNHNINTVVDLW